LKIGLHKIVEAGTMHWPLIQQLPRQKGSKLNSRFMEIMSAGLQLGML